MRKRWWLFKKKKYNRRNQRKIPIWLNAGLCMCVYVVCMLSRFSHSISDRRIQRRSSNFLQYTTKSIHQPSNQQTKPNNQPTIQSAIKFFSFSAQTKPNQNEAWTLSSNTHERTSAIAFVYMPHIQAPSQSALVLFNVRAREREFV